MMSTKELVIQARESGKTYTEIEREFDVPRSTARGWYNYYIQTAGLPEEPQRAYVNETFQRVAPPRVKKDPEAVYEFLENLAPIQINAGFVKSNAVLNDYAVIGSDFHFGCHDQRSIDIFLTTIQELSPKVIVLNGDLMDFQAVSKFPKDLRHNWSLLEERVAYRKFLAELEEVSKGAEIYETVSNHSGNSIDGRWRRYLSQRLGELSSLPDILDALSYETVFMGEFKDVVKHVDYVDLNGLVVTHGTTVRKNGGASALGELDKWKTSIYHGHTHRLGMTAQRIPAIGGREERTMYGYEGGCLCNLDAAYGTAMNWNSGFGIVALSDYGFGVEQVLINDGVANIATLGKTIVSK